MQFFTLLTVTISHTYYGKGCRDFSFIIPADARQLLKNGKLITRMCEGKLYVLFTPHETEPGLFEIAGKTLRIGLKLLNPFFSNFTDFDFNSTIPIYRNTNNPNHLDPLEKMVLVGQVFNHSLVETGRPVVVSLKDPYGQILQQDTITAEHNRLSVSYDLTGLAAGVYRIEESHSGNTTTTPYYADTELQGKGIFGVIEIEIDSTFYETTPPAPPEFVIPFTAKQETLKYYVVAKNYTVEDFSQISVLDKGEEGRSPINFTKVLSDDFTQDDISPILLGNGDAQIALFKSDNLVMRQEKARKNIQLQKQKNGAVEELIKNLPQPSASKVNSDLIVKLAKP
ncbi:hypothetical protein [Crocosphaera sp.]|uniref:hypothetical protein n=1 Tax=Crocosphaera sp. TaxID=2729996 RepID=UPI003F204E18|nr:hypothetical protein [Crocosphaera sp.]